MLMLEVRFTQADLLKVPQAPILAEFYLRSRLKKAGFDLGKEIRFHHDPITNECVYRQKEGYKE